MVAGLAIVVPVCGVHCSGAFYYRSVVLFLTLWWGILVCVCALGVVMGGAVRYVHLPCPDIDVMLTDQYEHQQYWQRLLLNAMLVDNERLNYIFFQNGHHYVSTMYCVA